MSVVSLWDFIRGFALLPTERLAIKRIHRGPIKFSS